MPKHLNPRSKYLLRVFSNRTNRLPKPLGSAQTEVGIEPTITAGLQYKSESIPKMQTIAERRPLPPINKTAERRRLPPVLLYNFLRRLSIEKKREKNKRFDKAQNVCYLSYFIPTPACSCRCSCLGTVFHRLFAPMRRFCRKRILFFPPLSAHRKMQDQRS